MGPWSNGMTLPSHGRDSGFNSRRVHMSCFEFIPSREGEEIGEIEEDIVEYVDFLSRVKPERVRRGTRNNLILVYNRLTSDFLDGFPDSLWKGLKVSVIRYG